MWKPAIFLVLIAVGLTHYLRSISGFFVSEPQVPNLPDTFWGPESNKKASHEIRPFKINAPPKLIEDLKQQLENVRPFVPPLEGTNWTYGISSKYLSTVLNYWRTQYNWSERQKLLNKYPQFKTNIQGLDIHFYHVKPQVPKDRKVKILPLLLLHGWPGSVVEFQKIIPMLTTAPADKNFVFEVIVPSLPGYGFSDGAVRPGLGASQIAVVMKNLMLRLGHEKFYLQGGDWGSIIVANLAALFPDHVIGVHSNMCFVNNACNFFWHVVGSIYPRLVVSQEYEYYLYPMSKHFSLLLEESGYFHIQATKPDTIGTALTASPVGLAAYILEKFSTWTNSEYKHREDGGLLEKFTLDELLDNVMIYYVSNSITTSVRLYAEHFSKANRALGIDNLPVHVPYACAIFPESELKQPESFLEKRFPKLIQATRVARGGHFAAFEEPTILSDDVFLFVEKVERQLKEEQMKASAAAQKQTKEQKPKKA
ncbi:juvenile hormone epoxide hydrolase 1-like [Prorops nasuta]|uniref:juvenile hormone epoxide hydrolase 1-like n=1 Tax=Prorops nasuta TaxID=863751 RepID=UPI0034CF773F